MLSQRSRRNKAIFNSCLHIARTNKILLLFPLISTTLNTTIMFFFAHPWIEHETKRLAHEHTPFFHYASFYTALLLFFYLRNFVNSLFNTALTTGIQLSLNQNTKKVVSTTIKKTLKRFRSIFLWSNFMSCFGGCYKLYCTVIAHNHARRAFGGSYLHTAALISSMAIIEDNRSPKQLLAYYGELFSQRWGKPPLRQGFSIIGRLLALSVFCLIPAAAVLLFFSEQLHWISLGITLSACLLIVYFSIEKLIVHVLHQALFEYCVNEKTYPPFTAEELKKAFVPFVIEQ